jgi:hypothetical protein
MDRRNFTFDELEFVQYGKLTRVEKYYRLLACDKEKFNQSLEAYKKAYREYWKSLEVWNAKQSNLKDTRTGIRILIFSLIIIGLIVVAEGAADVIGGVLFAIGFIGSIFAWEWAPKAPNKPIKPDSLNYFTTDESGRAYWELKSDNTVKLEEAKAYPMSLVPTDETDFNCPKCEGKGGGGTAAHSYEERRRMRGGQADERYYWYETHWVNVPDTRWTCKVCKGTGVLTGLKGVRQKFIELNNYLYMFNSKLDIINRKVQDLNEIT